MDRPATGAGCCIAWLLALILAACAPAPPDTAVVVEWVAADGAGAKAGLRSGDLLLSFRRAAAPPANPQPAEGSLASCLDFALVEVEQAPRGPVELTVRRERRRLALEIPPGEWKTAVLPRPGDAADRPVCEALARGRQEAEAKQWQPAQAAFEEALAAAKPLGQPLIEALILHEQGAARVAEQSFPKAEEAFRAALVLRRQAAPGSLAEAASWHALGRLHRIRTELDQADEELGKALALWERQAPASLERAWTLNNLGSVAWFRGRWDEARKFYVAALELARRLAPDSLYEAQILNNLGSLLRSMGDPAEAEKHYLRATRLIRRASPGHEDLPRLLTNLAMVAADRGDLAQSDDYLYQGLALVDPAPAETLVAAHLLNRLGGNARDRGDLEQAVLLKGRALEIHRRLAPGSLGEASTLSELSFVAMKRGRLDDAERWGREALAIQERHAPDSAFVVSTLQALGLTAMKRRDFAAADQHLERAVALSRRLGVGLNHEAAAQANLGYSYELSGRWAKAERCLARSLSLTRRLLPGTTREAQAWASLGELYARMGRDREAEAALAAAVDVFEAQIGRLGGADEARAGYLDSYLYFYHLLIDLQVRHGRPADALLTLERSRGRSLLTELARRDLAFAADLPAELRERLRRLDREYERVQGAVAAAGPQVGAAELEARLARLAALRSERALVAQEIARASPRYASLTSPRALPLAEIRAVLDPGTAWLSYAVASEKTLLFVVRPEREGVEVFTIPAGRERMVEEVAVFRGLLLAGREGAGPASGALRAQARKLYDLLLAPAGAAFATAERLLISADGPLHLLPFAALASPGQRGRFLVEDKPVHLALSATVYAELRRARPAGPAAATGLVAFGDPLVRAEAGAAGGERPLARYRGGLPPMPGARAEAEALAALYRPRGVAYLGAEATEKAVKGLGASPRYLHFATHALLDPRSPLDSALALATPRSAAEADNGLLQAWEIFDHLRLEADLVTLSACDTALGKDAAGEGLIGLTRAFQYAGARSVLASLWPVSDRSTTELMRRFYAALVAGAPKDQALAEAQRSLAGMDDSELSHPFHWAAFELIGDWR